MKETCIVIAAYNEEKNIANVVNSLKQEGYNNLIVVDDGSKDNTFQIAKQNGATALKHIVNRGQGAALQTGMTFALKNGADFIVHFDADGQHDSKEIKSMLMPLQSKETEITLGSRFLKKQKIPFTRKLMLKGGIIAVWAIHGIKLSDTHNGFRAFTKKAAKRIIITADKMEHASEILEKIKKYQIPYKEIPVTITYNEETLKNGRKGQGQFDSIKILIKMIIRKIKWT
jgi:polyprenyl-phospho-N-acetylgalactosaminyl synthase